MLYLGIDVGKFSHFLCLLDEEGEETVFEVSSTGQGFKKLSRFIKGLKVEELLVGMEATGHYFMNIYEFLLNEGITEEQIAILNPLQVKAFRNTNLRGAKSDRIDASRIASLLRFGEFQRCNIGADKVISLRQLTRLRSELVSSNADIKRKIISILDRVFPEFAGIFSNTFGKTALHLLSNYPLPEEIAGLSLSKLEKIIKGLSRRGMERAKIEKLHHLAANSVGIKLGREGLRVELEILVSRLKMCQEQVRELEERIEKMAKEFPSYRYLCSIPGVGANTGAAILAEIGEIERFSSSTKLVAFAGLDPKLRESGRYQGKTPISKRGSKYLRSALWMSAMVAARIDPMFKKIYQDKRKKSGSHKYAVTAAANKMTRVVYSIMKQKRLFEKRDP